MIGIDDQTRAKGGGGWDATSVTLKYILQKEGQLATTSETQTNLITTSIAGIIEAIEELQGF